MTTIMASTDISCTEREPYALQVLGNDMAPEFPENCIILLERDSTKQPDSYVVALVEGSRWFRQYCVDSDGREYLRACNQAFPDIELSGLDWQIEGIVRQKNYQRQVCKY